MHKEFSHRFFVFAISLMAGMLLLTILYFFSFLFIGPQSSPVDEEQQPIYTQAQASFSDVTVIAGITHSHIQNSGHIRDLIDGMGGGACAADFDNDGWVDLLFTAGGGQTRFYGRKPWWQEHRSVVLYRNSYGKFDPYPAPALAIDESTTACATADFNLDGLIDIIIATTDTDYLFANLGDMQFSKVTEFSQVATPVWTSQVSVADINGDGLPDLHLSHFLKYRQNLKNLELSSGFTEQHHLQMDPSKFDGLANQILINNGNFNFSDKSSQLGFALHAERTIASSWLDIDLDGDLDLLEYNMGDQPLRTYLQQDQPLTFKEIIRQDWGMRANNVHYSSMGQQILDSQPLWLATRGAGLANLTKYAPNFKSDLSWELGLTSHNFIYQQQWGTIFSDFNNDGYSDIAIASGNFSPDIFSPQMSISMPDLCATRQSNHHTINQAAFAVAPCLSSNTISSRGAIKLDYNNDGRMDILFVGNNDFPLLMKNTSEQTGNWISLIAGKGVIIEVKTPNSNMLTNKTDKQALFGNHDPRWHLGLGPIESANVRVISGVGKLLNQQQLLANSFYQFDGKTWHKQEYPARNVGSEKLDGAMDIATFIRASTNQVKNEQWLQTASNILNKAAVRQQNELALLINQSFQRENIPFYFVLLNHQNAKLADAAALTIQQLEQEYSTSRLLPWLESFDDAQYCRVAKIFSHWYDEEEAVTRSKQRAIPYLIRGLSSTNTKIVSCSAMALGASEHINGAFAILQMVENASAETQPTLINALGKIRQNAATPALLNLLSNSRNVAVIQQSLIALSRLNFSQLENSINNSSSERSHLFWLALTMLDKAPDGIVIDNQLRTQWLKKFEQPTYEDFIAAQDKILFLQAALLGRATLSFDNLLDGNENNYDLRQKVALMLAPNDISAKRITQLLNLSLSASELLQISKKIPPEYKFDQRLTKLGTLNGLGVWFSATEKQQNQLANLLNNLTNTSPPKATIITFLTQCASSSSVFNPQVADNWPQSVKTLVTSCRLLAYVKFGAEKNIQLRDAQELLEIGDEATVIVNNLKQITSNLAGIYLSRLSTLILYRTKLAQAVKSEWALDHFKTDNLSKSWLIDQISHGDNQLLSYVLDLQGYPILAANMDIENLMNKSTLHPDLKNRLSSYLQLEQYKNTRAIHD